MGGALSLHVTCQDQDIPTNKIKLPVETNKNDVVSKLLEVILVELKKELVFRGSDTTSLVVRELRQGDISLARTIRISDLNNSQDLIAVFSLGGVKEKLKEAADMQSYRAHRKIPWEQLEFSIEDKPIAEGGGGILWKGKYFNKDVAIKLVYGFEQELDREVDAMMQLNFPNIIQLLGWSTHNDKNYLVTNYIPHGSLKSFFQTKLWALDWPLALKFAEDVVDGMAYLHHNKITHRDLKLDNILVVSQLISSPINCVLIDFGIAANTIQTLQTKVGTPGYMAPEVMQGKYDASVDVFAFGIILWQLATKQLELWPDMHVLDMQLKLEKGERPDIPPTCNANLKALIEACWHRDPKQRPPFTDIRKALAVIKTQDVPTVSVIDIGHEIYGAVRDVEPLGAVHISLHYLKGSFKVALIIEKTPILTRDLSALIKNDTLTITLSPSEVIHALKVGRNTAYALTKVVIGDQLSQNDLSVVITIEGFEFKPPSDVHGFVNVAYTILGLSNVVQFGSISDGSPYPSFPQHLPPPSAIIVEETSADVNIDNTNNNNNNSHVHLSSSPLSTSPSPSLPPMEEVGEFDMTTHLMALLSTHPELKNDPEALLSVITPFISSVPQPVLLKILSDFVGPQLQPLLMRFMLQHKK